MTPTEIEAKTLFDPQAVTRAADGEQPTAQFRTPRQRQGDFDRADKELVRQGL